MRRAWWALHNSAALILCPGTALWLHGFAGGTATEGAEADGTAAETVGDGIAPLGDPYLHLVENGRRRFLFLSYDGSLLTSPDQFGEVGVCG